MFAWQKESGKKARLFGSHASIFGGICLTVSAMKLFSDNTGNRTNLMNIWKLQKVDQEKNGQAYPWTDNRDHYPEICQRLLPMGS